MNKYMMGLLCLFAYSTTVVGAEGGLIDAVKANDTKNVQLLLKGKVNVNEPQQDGATAVHWAVHRDNPDMLELLLAAGAQVNVPDQGGATPLWVAIRNDNLDMVVRLLKAGADPNIPLEMGETPLMTAAEIGNLDVVKALIAAKADVNAKEPVGGQTALMWAVADGHSNVAQVLIDSGAKVKERSGAGLTPLHFAGLNGRKDAAQLLVSMDAEVNEMSLDEMSPLLLAAAGGHDEMTRYLLEQGADATAMDSRGYTALHYAAMQRRMVESVRSLLEKGADPNARVLNSGSDNELLPVPDLPFLASPTRIIETGIRGDTLPTGATPVYLAAQQRNAAAIRLLVEHGADLNLASNESVFFLGGSGRRVNYIAGTTPLMAAAGVDRVADNWIGYSADVEKQALETVQVALELGADVNAVNEYGMTALHGATFINADSIIELLVKHGADINAKDQFGQTPVSIARHVIVAGLGDYFDVRPRRSSPSTLALLMKLGATPLEESDVVARGTD